jgi:hypothetical protein
VHFRVTGRTVCPRCKKEREFSSAIYADTVETALQLLKERHRNCFSCSMFGIEANVDFKSNIQVEDEVIDSSLAEPASHSGLTRISC